MGKAVISFSCRVRSRADDRSPAFLHSRRTFRRSFAYGSHAASENSYIPIRRISHSPANRKSAVFGNLAVSPKSRSSAKSKVRIASRPRFGPANLIVTIFLFFLNAKYFLFYYFYFILIASEIECLYTAFKLHYSHYKKNIYIFL